MRASFRLILGLAICLVTSHFSRLSGDALRDETSLKFIPASASFYLASLRLGEQWDAISKSRAYAKLMDLPLTKKIISEIKDEWENADDEHSQKIREFLTASENKGLMALLCDLAAHEVFLYGDESFGKLLGRLNELNQNMSQIQWRTIGRKDVDKDQLEREVVGDLIKSVGTLQVPVVAMGFRTSMADKAREELSRLKEVVRRAIGDVDSLQDHYREINKSGVDMLALDLDGSMIPWEKIQEESPEMREQLEDLSKELADRKVTIAFGLFRDYVVLIMTPEPEVAEALTANTLLVDSKPFQRLKNHESERMASIGYMSDAFARSLSNPKQQLRQLTQMADAVVPIMGLDEALQKELKSDVGELVADLERLVPEPGAIMSFAFLTNAGYEGYIENWTKGTRLNGSEPLSILQHAGGDPLLVVAGNHKRMESNLGHKWLGRLHYYLDKVVFEKRLDKDQLQLYTEFRDAFTPVVNKFSEATTNHWEKAFTDGQSALVVDNKLDPKPIWHLIMPASDKPLPMLEIAVVHPLNDREQLEEALTGYRKAATEGIKRLKEFFADHADEVQGLLKGPAQALPGLLENAEMPSPQVREVEDGKILYPLALQRAGVDSALAPNMGWNGEAFVVSLSPDTTERLLESKPISGPLSKAKGKKLAAATYVNVARLVGFFRPWVAYGMNIAANQSGDEEIQEFAPQIDTLMEIMQCYRQYYSITMKNDESLLTHFRSDFKDLE